MELQPAPEQLLPALAYVVAKGKEPAVSEALGALAALGDAAAPALSEALSRPEARERAALLITHLGPTAKATIPALVQAANDADPLVRREVLFALASMGADAASATDTVRAALADAEPRNAAVAAYALGRIGPAAKAAIPKLQTELTSADPLVRVASAYALVNVAPGNQKIIEASLPVLVQGLSHELPAARRGAAEALGAIGKPARSLGEGPLRKAAQDTDPTVRVAALEALERLGVVVDQSSRQVE
jgi:HEAT repeat protein